LLTYIVRLLNKYFKILQNSQYKDKFVYSLWKGWRWSLVSFYVYVNEERSRNIFDYFSLWANRYF